MMQNQQRVHLESPAAIKRPERRDRALLAQQARALDALPQWLSRTLSKSYRQRPQLLAEALGDFAALPALADCKEQLVKLATTAAAAAATTITTTAAGAQSASAKESGGRKAQTSAPKPTSTAAASASSSGGSATGRKPRAAPVPIPAPPAGSSEATMKAYYEAIAATAKTPTAVGEGLVNSAEAEADDGPVPTADAEATAAEDNANGIVAHHQRGPGKRASHPPVVFSPAPSPQSRGKKSKAAASTSRGLRKQQPVVTPSPEPTPGDSNALPQPAEDCSVTFSKSQLAALLTSVAAVGQSSRSAGAASGSSAATQADAANPSPRASSKGKSTTGAAKVKAEPASASAGSAKGAQQSPAKPAAAAAKSAAKPQPQPHSHSALARAQHQQQQQPQQSPVGVAPPGYTLVADSMLPFLTGTLRTPSASAASSTPKPATPPHPHPLKRKATSAASAQPAAKKAKKRYARPFFFLSSAPATRCSDMAYTLSVRSPPQQASTCCRGCRCRSGRRQHGGSRGGPQSCDRGRASGWQRGHHCRSRFGCALVACQHILSRRHCIARRRRRRRG
jgi:hypothetical protein